jgi:hypothetical protein
VLQTDAHPKLLTRIRVSISLEQKMTAEAAKYDAFGPNHGGAFRPFDCGRTA